MHILKSIVIAFSMYSKIPMPQFEWKEEDMKHVLSMDWYCDRALSLFLAAALRPVRDQKSVLCVYRHSNPPAFDWWFPCGWFYGYNGCVSFLPTERAEIRDFKGFPYRGICRDHVSGVWIDLYGGIFRDYG